MTVHTRDTQIHSVNVLSTIKNNENIMPCFRFLVKVGSWEDDWIHLLKDFRALLSHMLYNIITLHASQ